MIWIMRQRSKTKKNVKICLLLLVLVFLRAGLQMLSESSESFILVWKTLYTA